MDRKKSGFTLAELLIVVAIIAVLVAISIPVFSSQLEKARRAVDVENARNIRSVLANAINDESFVFNNKDAMLEVVVSRNEKTVALVEIMDRLKMILLLMESNTIMRQMVIFTATSLYGIFWRRMVFKRI